MTQPGFEPTSSRSEVDHANHYTIEASYKKGQIFRVESYNVLLFCEVKIKIHDNYNEWILASAEIGFYTPLFSDMVCIPIHKKKLINSKCVPVIKSITHVVHTLLLCDI